MPLGEARLPGITAEDIGRCSYPIFKHPARFVGETIGIAGEHTTGNQLAAGLSKVFGEPVRYQHVPAEVFRGLPFPGADLAANMFQFVTDDNGYGRRRDVAVARSLNPSLVGFAEWVAATRGRGPRRSAEDYGGDGNPSEKQTEAAYDAEAFVEQQHRQRDGDRRVESG